MGRNGRGHSGLGRQGACALAVLLFWLCLPPLSAQPSNQNNQNLAKVCGRSKATEKIFGGQAAGPERWPWQASLVYRGGHTCGATLISSTWVLSAAHCLQRSRSPSDYRILLGYNQLSKPTNFSRQMTVHKVIVHEDYNRKYRFGSNITLPQLNVPVDFNSHILSACLPDNSAVVPMNSSCWISGWGRLTEDVFLPAPFHLQEAKVSLIDQDRCEKFYIPHPAIPPDQAVTVQEDMICAGDTKVEKGICRGDSGGPLSCFLNGAWHVVGLSSWNWDCRSPIGYSVFVRITYFANWIKEKQRVNPAPNPSSAPPQEKPPAMTNNPIPEVGTVCQPSFFLLLLLSATVPLQLVLQSL